jgi:hypothetical protein
VGVVVLTRLSVSYPVAGSSVAALFGGIALVLVVYRLLSPPGGGGVEREIGVWLGLVFAAAVALGGYLGMQPRKAPRAVSAG